MNKKTGSIELRVSAEEKSRFAMSAKKCGLSLSEYLRMLANGYKPKPLPPIEYRELMNRITDLYLEFNERGEAKYADLLVEVLRDMTVAISPKA
jgi:antitoxin component of RelBE/YafQ-DinJ toxin-antitoxin module